VRICPKKFCKSVSEIVVRWDCLKADYPLLNCFSRIVEANVNVF
jgi:hypothetical protein